MLNSQIKRIYIEEVDSTNNYLKEAIKGGRIIEDTAIMAKHQTLGRGRLGRTWISSPDNTLCMSVAIKCSYNEGFPLLVALAVRKTLQSYCEDKNLLVKWPNDIVHENKKLCGILCERVKNYTIIGVGVNVNNQTFDKSINEKATSLYLLNNKTYSLQKVFSDLLLSLEKYLLTYNFAFNTSALQEYTSLCINLGREVLSGEKKGIATGIDIDGSLIIKTQGTTEKISSGEVFISGIY